MNKKIIGRISEKASLNEVYSSNESQFLAITGRRRIGKTYLINSFFDKNITFHFSGILNASFGQQLQNFQYSLTSYFKSEKPANIPTNWLSAFQNLSICLQKNKKKGKQIIFIDELPWLDTHKSNFIAALDWFWNSWAVNRNILLIVCGSSTSWIINKVLNNKGGLHNRITKRIHLEPFTLHETELFLKYKKVQLSKYQITQLYMSLGGVPHYLKEVKPGESALQAIDRICFQKDGLLVNEFDNLYKALFKNSELHLKVIFALSSKSRGLTRNEILSLTNLNDGGSFTNVLNELEWCNFIRLQPAYGRTKKDTLYRLSDEYSLFYIRFINKQKTINWTLLGQSQKWKSWSGYAFENICLKHMLQLKKALGISNVFSEITSYTQKAKTDVSDGTQIDLLIDRNDGIINVCEAKFYDKPFVISKEYATKLNKKINVFQENSKSNKTIFPTIITTFGLQANEHSIGFIQQEITLEDLFQP
jgi:AAA+ ATPase superfamily predicted ATPase